MLSKFSYLARVTRGADTYGNMFYHTCCEIVYYISGNGKTMIDGKEYSYSPGTFAIIKPYIMHDETRFSESEILFLGTIVSDVDKIYKNGVFPDTNKNIYHIMKKIEKEYNNHSYLYNQYMNLLCAELYITICRTLRVDNNNEDNFEYTINYIDEYFNEDIKIDSLAKMSGYSYHHFRHLFKAKTGLAPFEYIIEKRIDAAKNLLLSTNKPITYISETCGFSSCSQFSMLFKKHCGLSPKQFRLNKN